MHILRLGYQGVELMQTGRLTLPVEPESRLFMLNVRRGSVELQSVLSKAGELERELKDLMDASPLPDEPENERVEAWMIEKYQQAWDRTSIAKK